MKTHFAILTAAGAAAGLTAAADAYTIHGSWLSNNVTMRASATSFPSGSSFRSSLSTVVSRFNNNPSQMRLTQQFGDTSVALGNFQNETWFSSSSDYDPAVTFSWYAWPTQIIIESDVVFFSGESYTTSMSKTSLWPYGGNGRPFQTTAMHEYGHVAGLGHEDDEYNIMGEDWNHLLLNGSTCRSYLGEDGCDGLVDTYGRKSGSSIEDVSVVHWRWEGRDGEYSTHQQCRMLTSSGGTLSSSTFAGDQRRYSVSRGQQVQVEFSYENNGETTQAPNVAFYISTNSYISTGDRRIATASMTLARNSVWTTRHTVTIPWDLSRNRTYYLGVIVDWDNRISEVDGQNAAYHVIRTN